MKQILKINEIKKLIKKNKNQKIVLVGGCFDIVHLGHVMFLEKARERGDMLVVLLESDENIKKNKGQNRPINNQESRAIFLTKLKTVNYVIKLPKMKNDEDYLKVIKIIKPAIIAVNKQDNNFKKKKKQAKEIGAKIIKVSKLIPQQSTSRIIDIIKL